MSQGGNNGNGKKVQVRPKSPPNPFKIGTSSGGSVAVVTNLGGMTPAPSDQLQVPNNQSSGQQVQQPAPSAKRPGSAPAPTKNSHKESGGDSPVPAKQSSLHQHISFSQTGPISPPSDLRHLTQGQNNSDANDASNANASSQGQQTVPASQSGPSDEKAAKKAELQSKIDEGIAELERLHGSPVETSPTSSRVSSPSIKRNSPAKNQEQDSKRRLGYRQARASSSENLTTRPRKPTVGANADGTAAAQSASNANAGESMLLPGQLPSTSSSPTHASTGANAAADNKAELFAKEVEDDIDELNKAFGSPNMDDQKLSGKGSNVVGSTAASPQPANAAGSANAMGSNANAAGFAGERASSPSDSGTAEPYPKQPQLPEYMGNNMSYQNYGAPRREVCILFQPKTAGTQSSNAANAVAVQGQPGSGTSNGVGNANAASAGAASQAMVGNNAVPGGVVIMEPPVNLFNAAGTGANPGAQQPAGPGQQQGTESQQQTQKTTSSPCCVIL